MYVMLCLVSHWGECGIRDIQQTSVLYLKGLILGTGGCGDMLTRDKTADTRSIRTRLKENESIK